VFDPKEIQDDSVGFDKQVKNYPLQLVRFFPKDNAATTLNDSNVVSLGNV
jgi:hypothetical protein